MKNRWIKWSVVAMLGVGICILILHVLLQVLSNSLWVQQQVAQQIAASTGREVRLGRIHLHLRGLRVEDFSLAKAGGFEEGTLIEVQQLHLTLAPWHLLHGHLKVTAAHVEGLVLHVVQDQQGRWNLDLAGAQVETKEQTDSSVWPIYFSVSELAARRFTLYYTDEKTNHQLVLKNADLLLRNFSLEKSFQLRFNATVQLERPTQTYTFPLALAGQANLAQLDWQQAWVEISSLVLKSGAARLQAAGRVNNLEEPRFVLTVSGEKLSPHALAGLVPAELDFLITQVQAKAQGRLSLDKNTWQVDKSVVSLPGLRVEALGEGEFTSVPRRLQATVTAQLEKIQEELLFLAPYQLAGQLEGQLRADARQLSAQATWREGAGFIKPVGRISQAAFSLEGQESTRFENGQWTLTAQGHFNDEPFQAKLTLTQQLERLIVQLHARAKRVVLPPSPPSAPASAKQTEDAVRTWPLPPITFQSDVKIDSIDAPFLNGKDLNFQMDVAGITPRLDQAHGDLLFEIHRGAITDLYRLADLNSLAKVLFLSLNVVGKVFNSLDVLDVLGGLTGNSATDTSSTETVIKMIEGEDGQPVAIRVPAKERKVDGTLVYESFQTQVQFNQGLAQVEEGAFVSDTMSFQVTGTADFKTEQLDMMVKAAPGRHETGGIMPLTLKIDGTVSEPQGSMRVLRSVSSLVTQGVTNNFASRAVKKTLGGFFGLFKKKKTSTVAPTSTEDAVAPEE